MRFFAVMTIFGGFVLSPALLLPSVRHFLRASWRDEPVMTVFFGTTMALCAGTAVLCFWLAHVFER